MNARVIPIAADTGTAYGMPPATHRRELTEVGPGTPMGELLRRYWHPIGLVADATATPRNLRVLGEDLVLFRDGSGKPGLVYPHCAHRGTSLVYGKVEERGIRCCYHGWLFSAEGHCLEQPCEPEGGKFRDKVRQPWYPVQELYGLLWAYMGPPEKKPVLPRYACLEELEDGEFLETDDRSIGGGGPTIVDCNWLQHYENLVDPFHVVILHSSFSGTQFVPEMAVMPQVTWDTASCPTAAPSAASARPACPRCASSPRRAWAASARWSRWAGCCPSTTRTSASTWWAGCARPASCSACAHGRMASGCGRSSARPSTETTPATTRPWSARARSPSTRRSTWRPRIAAS